MEEIDNQVQDENSLVINEEINEYLSETSRWANFLAIVGYVGMGLLMVIAIVMMVGLSRMGDMVGSRIPGGLMGFIYIIFAVIYYFPVSYLHKFSREMKQGLSSKDMNSVSFGFKNLKSLFKFLGIFTIVILSVYALIFLFTIPTMLFLRH
jgi:hypothetical protein